MYLNATASALVGIDADDGIGVERGLGVEAVAGAAAESLR